MSDVESSLSFPDKDNKSLKASNSNEYSNMLKLMNESVTNTKLPEKTKSKSKPKTNKTNSENTKVKKRRQLSTIVAVAPPSEELIPEPTINNNDDYENSENWTAEDTNDEMLEFDGGGTVEFSVQISRFVALAAAMLVVECVKKQPKFTKEIAAERQISKTEQLLNDAKRSLPKASSLQSSKEVLKICSKQDTNLNPVKDEKSKTFTYRRKHSSKETLKQDTTSNNTTNETEIRRNSLPRSDPSSKEILKKISKQDAIPNNSSKVEKLKKSKPRSKQSSKEVSKDNSKLDIDSSAPSAIKEEKSKKPVFKTKNSSKEPEVVKVNSNQDQDSTAEKVDKPKKSTTRSKKVRKEVSKDGSKQDIDSSTTNKENPETSISETKHSGTEVLKVTSNQDQNLNVTNDDEDKKQKKSIIKNNKQSSNDVSKVSSNQDQDINSNVVKEAKPKKSKIKNKQSSKEIVKVSSTQDQDMNSVEVQEEQPPPKKSKIKNKQSSKEIVKVSSNQDQDINSVEAPEEQPQPKKTRSKKAKSNAKNTTNTSTTEVREETAEVLDFEEKQKEPEQKPRRPAKKKRTKKPISPINEAEVEREPDTAVSKPELETFLVEATGQSENVVTSFSTKRKSKKSVKNKKVKIDPEAPAPMSIPFQNFQVNEEPQPEPEPEIKEVVKKKSSDDLSSSPGTPTSCVALLPPTASEVSISTTGSCHAVTYPPVPTIGANMGDQLEVLKYLVQIQNYINHLGYHHHHLGEPKIHINTRHSMKLQMKAAREIMQASEPIKSLHAAVLAVHFTNSLEAVERFPIYFRSHVSSKEYKHIVLGIFVQGNYGALGISRDSGLQDKPASYSKLSDLIFEFAKCYGHSGHVLNEVHFGCIMPHDPLSSERLFTKSHVIPICGCLHSEIDKNIEKFAKQLKNKMGRACMKIKPRRLRDLNRLSKNSYDFNKSSRTGLLDYVSVSGSETSSCANIRIRVLNMNMSVNLLDSGPIRLSKNPTKNK